MSFAKVNTNTTLNAHVLLIQFAQPTALAMMQDVTQICSPIYGYKHQKTLKKLDPNFKYIFSASFFSHIKLT